MARRLTWLNRLRIERFVWTLDQYLFDLPPSSRKAKRREVRDNLIAAAEDVGTTEALRRLGGSRRLAEGYLSAELGDRPRHSWIAAFFFLTLYPMVILFSFNEAGLAFEQGVTAADPNATGTFIWAGFSYLQKPITYTFTDGQASHAGGSFTLLFYALWVAGAILAGRLWRLFPRRVTAHS